MLRFTIAAAAFALAGCATPAPPAAQDAMLTHCQAQGFAPGLQMNACLKQMEDTLRAARRPTLR